jgi:DNA (cytosine-5)-methyltransferase 1
MGTVLGSLAELGYGYAYRVLDAQYMGVPQRRRRVFIVGHLGAPWSASPQVLFEPDSGEGDPPPCDEEGEDDAEGAGDGAEERGVQRIVSSFTPVSGGPDDNDAQAGHLVIERTFVGDGWGEDVARTLTSPAHGPHFDLDTENFVVDPQEPWALNAGQENIWQQGVTPAITGSKGNPGAVTYRKVHRAHNVDDPETWDEAEVANTLNPFDSTDVRSTQVVVGFSTKDYGGDAAEELAPTVRSMNFDKSHINGGGQAGVSVDLSVRRLTPLECERLQGFPDGWTDGQSDTARYRQLGNAVAVVCSTWIAKRMADVERRTIDTSTTTELEST